MDWSGEMLSMLSDRWEADDSLNVIAAKLSAEFDLTITRNAVAGKARRIGLPTRGLPQNIRDARDGKPRETKPRAPRNPPPPWSPAAVTAPVFFEPHPAPVEIEPDPNDTGCEYRLGDVAPRGAKAYGERYDSWAEVPVCRKPRRRNAETGAYTSSYCPHHHDICHTAPKESTGRPFVVFTPKHRGGGS